MPIGAQVKLDVLFNKPLAGKASDVILESAEPSMAIPKFASSTAAIDGGISDTWQGRANSLRFHCSAPTDTDGFTNNGLEEYELLVRPDQSPTVQIESPRRNEDRTAISTVPIEGLAEDDYGIQTLKLIVDRLSDKKHWEIPLVADAKPQSGIGWSRTDNSGDRLRFRMTYNWDLAKLADANLKPGDVLEYSLLVTDNFNLDGQTHPPVPSGRLRIAIISQEDLTAKVIDDLRQLKTLMGDVKTAQDRTKSQTQNLADETKAKLQLDAADKQAAERLENQQATAATEAKQLASKLDEIQARLDENKSTAQELKDLSRDVKNDLNDTAENPMKNAAAQINQANQPNAAPEQRNQQLADATKNQSQASDQLQRALDRMENIGTLQQTIDKIADLLNQQREITKQTADIGKQNLGKKPDEMKPEDRDKLNKNADAQAKLADKTAQAMASMSKTADQLEKSDPSASSAMKQAAQTAQQQQVQQNQQKAAGAAKQNQQAQAQSSQSQAGVGIADDAGSIERRLRKRKLAELSKQLAELNDQVVNLIRRQAGHNLDNLAIQGPDKIAKLDVTARSDLFDESGRDAKAPVTAQLPDLQAGQELTERNARDIGGSAEKMPNGAAVADQIIRAADKMERAIVYLRQTKLADAYDPPQTDALGGIAGSAKARRGHER